MWKPANATRRTSRRCPIISAIVGFATVVLWIESYVVRHELRYYRKPSTGEPWMLIFRSDRGKVTLFLDRFSEDVEGLSLSNDLVADVAEGPSDHFALSLTFPDIKMIRFPYYFIFLLTMIVPLHWMWSSRRAVRGFPVQAPANAEKDERQRSQRDASKRF